MFTIGIVQDHADADVQSNVTRATTHTRSRGPRRADRLFEGAVRCTSLSHSSATVSSSPRRFQDRRPTLSRPRAELGVVVIAPIFEREAAGVYRNSAAIIDADGSLLGVYARCTYRTTRCAEMLAPPW